MISIYTIYFMCKMYNHNFRYYERSEIKNFENLESEWPLFYIYMIIDGIFKSLPDQVSEYQELLKARIVIDQYGG